MENSLHPSSSFFSPEQQAKLIAAIFSHRLEHSGFLYEGDGAEYWEKVSEDPSYKFLDVDLQLLCHSQNALAKYFDKESTITDVGAGNGSKAIALLGIGPDTGKEFKKKYFTYRPSDSSYAMTLLAKKNVREQTHNPHIMFGNSQIMEGGQLLTNYLSHNTYLRLGGTIGNFSDSQIIKFLKAMDNHGTLQGNQILLSYFTPPTTAEIEDLKSCYDNQTAKDFVFNGVKNLGLSPEHFDFQVQYVYDARETV
ncbi:MAG: L-histidine N(alpha)-methyltransferase [Candidatus Peribacteria bacterium]|jgi:uncharacterized SAM-dependent methyltransferase|nr:L-histidine N(alpha)-methyltransferase [Candidatus Peribacteria bacterium]